MKEAFIQKTFHSKSQKLIDFVNEVVLDYEAQGYRLTLRQVYYQMVARNYIPNNERSYKMIGNLINDARLAGLIDWQAIEDRTRFLRANTHWDNPDQIIRSARYSYYKDHWKDQTYYVEVWVEKDALVDIVGQVCGQLDVPYFSCRGYTSQTEMYVAAKRLINRGRRPVIIHLGDHDPSGKDMSRDIEERLTMFGIDNLHFDRIALNMEQIERYNPPPNPAKLTDSRATNYIEKFGYDSWELDALEPQVITALIKSNINQYRDFKKWDRVETIQSNEKRDLEWIENNYAWLIENKYTIDNII